MSQIFKELKRRNIYKVAITYGLVAWVLAQVASLACTTFDAPDWIMKIIVVVLIIGFPIALILAWAFEMSPQGIIRTTSEESKKNPLPNQKKKPLTSNLVIGMLILIVVGQFAYNKYWQTGDFVNEKIEKSVAVLPFKNMSSNQENQFFCDGVMDAILNHLARIEGLYVPSRTTMEKYKESPLAMKEIAAELEVNYILEGSVQRNGNEVFIIAQLIDGKTDDHIWVNEYQRDITELFKVQAEVTKKIASELKANILPKVEERIEAIPTSNMTAYDFHLKGWDLIYKSYKTLDKKQWFHLQDSALVMFKSAIALDSTFAKPYGGITNLLFMKGNGGGGVNLNNALIDSALVYCNKGISFDKNDPELFWLRARCYEVTNREDSAFEEYQKVISLNPNNALSLQSLAEIYRKEGEYITAFKLLKRALKGDRSNHSQGRTNRFLGEFYASIGDLTEARESIEKAIDLQLEFNDYYNLAWTYWGQQEYEKAKNIVTSKFGPESGGYTHWSGQYYLFRGAYDKAVEFTTKNRENRDVNNFSYGWILHGMALDGVGRSEEGHAILKEQLQILEEKIQSKQINNLYGWDIWSIAGIYAYFGNTEKALEIFKKETFITANGLNPINFTEDNPLYRNLNSHPEFIKIMEDKKKEFKEIRDEISRLESLGEL
jgi:TolB-like protein/Flp pilus assembly protein TadD